MSVGVIGASRTRGLGALGMKPRSRLAQLRLGGHVHAGPQVRGVDRGRAAGLEIKEQLHAVGDASTEHEVRQKGATRRLVAVEVRDLGTGTSMLLFFRTLASVIGFATFGSIFSTRISDRLSPELIRTPRSIRLLPEPAKSQALAVMTDAIRLLFIVSIPILIIGFLAARAIREIPLRTSASTTDSSGPPGAIGH